MSQSFHYAACASAWAKSDTARDPQSLAQSAENAAKHKPMSQFTRQSGLIHWDNWPY
jgi:hypothetical protein